MGSWGPGPFDNDDALDFVGDLARGTPLGIRDRLVSIFENTRTDNHVELREANTAIAAAALLAIRNGAPEPDETAVTEWLQHAPMYPDQELCRLAVQALDRAFDPEASEWYELWDEADSLDQVEAALKPYREALQDGTT